MVSKLANKALGRLGFRVMIVSLFFVVVECLLLGHIEIVSFLVDQLGNKGDCRDPGCGHSDNGYRR